MELVSWNIQWARGCDGAVSVRRIADTLRANGDADVICLQEVARGFDDLPGLSGEDQVALFAACFPDHQAIFAPGTDSLRADGARRQFGNLTLSRLPVLQAWRHLLPWPADPAVPGMQRACAEVLLDVPGGGLRVLNTHLEYYSAQQRSAQMHALRALNAEALAHAAAPSATRNGSPAFAPVARPAAALLCGDFNCQPFSPEYLQLLAPGRDAAADWHDAWAFCRGDEPHAHTVGLHGCEWPDRPYCCDFAFASAALLPRLAGIRVDQATAASDHQPLWVTLDAHA
ncbi:MAG: endonuclease/exonuclease/phosphatase family protein [Gammaproteobacteria bacterium]|nr:endonuclease/exonuclease/phosphatase family protein [Gammaproteobacteria bacterium]MBU0771621.1 endonuclease/exonuclease/phosphatase family protein [Gammaproteobacteria bacterium]MBU0856894.1 endonuclease/exonuclease/phosphatase family protein [Gammaproteobacteria bacterium]MBU1848195.1 endonuclease/exonuclease/phosphatase family protein [Gammaproteobacteria bacterium]